MRRLSIIYKVAVVLIVGVIAVGCAVDFNDSPCEDQSSPSKPPVPIKRRPIGGSDIERPRIVEDKDWHFGIYPPRKMSAPYSVTVRSVATGEEFNVVLRSANDYFAIPRKVADDQYVITYESEGVVMVELVEF